ncbi:response regulator [bacterium]|nr:response regulator [bacterium]
MKARNSILCVDDEEDLLDILSYNLKKEGYLVFTAENGKIAIEKAISLKPNLILLDVMMDEIDGFEVCRTLRNHPETKDIPIIFLTAKTEEIDEIIALELGADDYVKKPFSPRKILAKIKAVFRRIKIESDVKDTANKEIVRTDGLEINYSTFTVKIDNVETKFLRKELQLLFYLMQHEEKAFSRDSLLNSVWGDDAFFTERTVDVHVAKIRKKLGKYAFYLKTVQGIGYKFSTSQ